MSSRWGHPEVELVHLWEQSESDGLGGWKPSSFLWADQYHLLSDADLTCGPRSVCAGDGYSWDSKWMASGSWVFSRGVPTERTQWTTNSRRASIRRRKLLRIRVYDDPRTLPRPKGTGTYRFTTVSCFENQRRTAAAGADSSAELIYSAAALDPNRDPPAFTAWDGSPDIERRRSFGYISDDKYCCWRSNWSPAVEWEYCDGFNQDAGRWFGAAKRPPVAARVRRRLLIQVCQIETISEQVQTDLSNGVVSTGVLSPARSSVEETDAAAPAKLDRALEGDESASATEIKSISGTSSLRRDVAVQDPPVLPPEPLGCAAESQARAALTPSATEHVPAPPPMYTWASVEGVVDAPVDTIFSLMFDDPSSKLASALHSRAGHTAVDSGEWDSNCRVVKYIMAKSALAKACQATERQNLSQKFPGALYTIDAIHTAPDLPFGKTFETHIRTVLSASADDQTKTTISMSSEMKFIKSTMMKKMILNSALKPVQSTQEKTLEAIQKFLQGKPVNNEDKGADELPDSAAGVGDSDMAKADPGSHGQGASDGALQTTERQRPITLRDMGERPRPKALPCSGGMTVNELRDVERRIEASEDRQELERLLWWCAAQACDDIARVRSLDAGESGWDICFAGGLGSNFQRQSDHWRATALMAVINVDDASNKLRYLPQEKGGAVAEGVLPGEEARRRAVAFLKSDTVADFIVEMANASQCSNHELIGLLSLLDEKDLVMKTMWSGSVQRAVETGNAEIIVDHQKRFEEDIVKSGGYGTAFDGTIRKKLCEALKESRNSELLDSIAKNDLSMAVSAVANLIRDSRVTAHGDAFACLSDTEEDHARLTQAALSFATTFISIAEKEAFARVTETRRNR